jgi:hypothetical protein
MLKHRDYAGLTKKLYVAMRHFECLPARESPFALRTMGRVAAAEFNCQAEYAERFQKLPEFNRKKLSLKFSRQQERRSPRSRTKTRS